MDPRSDPADEVKNYRLHAIWQVCYWYYHGAVTFTVRRYGSVSGNPAMRGELKQYPNECGDALVFRIWGVEGHCCTDGFTVSRSPYLVGKDVQLFSRIYREAVRLHKKRCKR